MYRLPDPAPLQNIYLFERNFSAHIFSKFGE
jgi:Spy/CpxP family protein refolding chaperone